MKRTKYRETAGALGTQQELIEAAKRYDFARVQALAERGDEVSAQDRLGNPAITYAILAVRSDMVAWFITAGADVNAQSLTGYTPLIVAAGQGDLQIVQLLLHAGAAPNKVTERGHSAQWMAQKRGHVAVAEVLRQAIAIHP